MARVDGLASTASTKRLWDGTARAGARGLLAALALVGVSAGTPAFAACTEPTVEARAATSLDARALKLQDGRVLRLAGIEPFTLLLGDSGSAEEQLAARLMDLVAGKALRVAIISAKPDRYGRVPALVSVGGSWLQEALAGEGLALAYATDDPLPCFSGILAEEADARRAGRGFWSNGSVLEATPEALAPRIGRFAIFEGTVVSVGARPATTYLDFGKKWSEDVTVEIPAKARTGFGGETALEKLAGARIRLRGFLVDKGGPMLPVRSAMQLEILSSGPRADRIAP